eukprot:1143563-Pelagomonas_calceolata.AAC.7
MLWPQGKEHLDNQRLLVGRPSFLVDAWLEVMVPALTALRTRQGCTSKWKSWYTNFQQTKYHRSDSASHNSLHQQRILISTPSSLDLRYRVPLLHRGQALVVGLVSPTPQQAKPCQPVPSAMHTDSIILFLTADASDKTSSGEPMD